MPTDEIYQRYLQKAISEINELGDEIGRAGDETHVPVLGSGHPLADVFLLKYEPKPSEVQEGVAFYGRAGQALLKSLQRLRVDPMSVYGTNCLKFAGQDPEEARPWLTQELHIVQPKLLVLMGEPTVEFVNALTFPLSDPLDPAAEGLQRFTGDRRGARRPGHRRRARRGAGEDGVLERLQGGRPVVARVAAVLRRPPPGTRTRGPDGGDRRVHRRRRPPLEGRPLAGRPLHRARPHPGDARARSGCCCRLRSGRGCWPVALGLVALAVRLRLADLDVLFNLAKLFALVLLGFWFLSFFENVAWAALVAAIIPWVDVWSVWLGPTGKIVERAAERLRARLDRLPRPWRAQHREPRAAGHPLLRPVRRRGARASASGPAGPGWR